MATIQTIDPTKSISLAPAILNQNFQNIATELSEIAGILKTINKSLELNGKITPPANSIEASTIILTATAGLLINGVTDGTTQVFTVDTDGLVVAKRIVLDQALASDFGAVNIFGLTTAKEKIVAEKDIQLTNSGVILYKNTVFTLTGSNIGDSASNPISIADKQELLFDASNGGSQFLPSGSDCLIKLDKASMKPNQIVTLRLAKKNPVNDMKLWNGNNTEPLFAKIDYTNGISDVPYTTYPQFDTTASGLAWMRCQYLEITAGVFRLLILEHSNMLNV